MKYNLAERLSRVKPSPTLAINAKAKKMRDEGHDIISMGVGEPDFDTPDHINQAAIDAIQSGQTRYTEVAGIRPLKEAICEKFKRDNGIIYNLDEVMVSTGGKQTIYNLLQSLVNPGDEVMIPSPYWVSYPDMVCLAEGIPVIIPSTMENGLKITPQHLKAAITEKTRMLFLNSPSNPTGISYTKDELLALAKVLRKHPKIWIATDDMYEHILWKGESFHNILMVAPDLKERTVVLNGVSKAYAMTGWRIGYIGGPDFLIKAMTKIQSQSTSNPCSIAQAAALAALQGTQACVTTMVAAFEHRYRYIYERINAIPHMNVLESQGTFYVFPDVSKVMEARGIQSDIQLSDQLLQDGVAVVPGSAFGKAGHIRLSFAMDEAILEEAMDRIAAGMMC